MQRSKRMRRGTAQRGRFLASTWLSQPTRIRTRRGTHETARPGPPLGTAHRHGHQKGRFATRHESTAQVLRARLGRAGHRIQVETGQGKGSQDVLRYVLPRTSRRAHDCHRTWTVLHRRIHPRARSAQTSVSLQDARANQGRTPVQRRRGCLPVQESCASGALRAVHPGASRGQCRRRSGVPGPSHLRTHPRRRHPRYRALSNVRGPEGGGEQPLHPLGVPAVLHAHGGAPRSDPAHDHQKKLRVYTLHHRTRYGRLQILSDRGGFLRAVRRPGIRQGARSRTRYGDRAQPQRRLHQGEGVRDRRRCGEGEFALFEAVGDQVPQDAEERRGDPRVVRIQVGGQGFAR
mmetsp:Transcript_11489/g.70639  ORF Transcript_11489/g.70639 Transcript_11489/m.70639 type:complete len:347 (+) Transcript_11489:255-1295(+)